MSCCRSLTRGSIRVLDLLILTKGDDGEIEAFESDEPPERGDVLAIEADIAEILADEDVALLAEAMEPGTTAGVLVWENTWAAPFASAARRPAGS